jgi:arsenate reductase (thioredoxin)
MLWLAVLVFMGLTPAPGVQASPPPQVVFVCAHGAAKSVIAAAYFNKLAAERGLAARATFRGVEPSDALSARAVAGLEADGVALPAGKPTAIGSADVAGATHVFTIGCALPVAGQGSVKVASWDDVPDDKGYEAMRDAIVRHVRTIVDSLGTSPAPQAPPPNPRQPPGATIAMFAPDQHDLYDGHYVLSATRIHMIGGLNDPAGWDHMDNDAKTVKLVEGTAAIDVDDRTNSGTFEARLKIPDGDLVLAIDRFHEFNPCQDGGIVGFLHEHGTDSGCGDSNWPKTFVYLAGWGYGHATLNGRPHYSDYEMHFMVTQGIRDRKTLRVNYPMAGKKGPAGEVNPATQQLDFYIRSPQQNPKNKPNREVFLHFFGMEVTWK